MDDQEIHEITKKPKDILSPQEVMELRNQWRGKWIAYVDDQGDEEELFRELFQSVLDLKVVEFSRDLKDKPGVVFHQFDDPKLFLDAQKGSGSYDVCIMDGRFDSADSMSGPKAARRVNQITPGIVIVARSAEPEFNAEFSRMPEIAAVIPKSSDLLSSFPQLARVLAEDNQE